MHHMHFPSIEGFHSVVKYAKMIGTEKVTYRGKVKLHGTNAGVQIIGDRVQAQSRTNMITPNDDNAGFAKWVDANKDFFLNKLRRDKITIFGEWCGPGIMKKTAINLIPNKIFAVFSIEAQNEDGLKVMVDPEGIENFLRLHNLPNDMYVIPWQGPEFTVDFSNEANLRKTASDLNKLIEEIEPCDPWVKSKFGVEGICEGLVFYPIRPDGDLLDRDFFSNFIFKAKGEQHKVVKTKEAVQVDPEVAASIEEFVNLFVTETRLEQGLVAVGAADLKKTGEFLKWFGQDVAKESVDELEASNLEWKQVQGSVSTAARNWFMAKCKEI